MAGPTISSSLTPSPSATAYTELESSSHSRKRSISTQTDPLDIDEDVLATLRRSNLSETTTSPVRGAFRPTSQLLSMSHLTLISPSSAPSGSITQESQRQESRESPQRKYKKIAPAPAQKISALRGWMAPEDANGVVLGLSHQHHPSPDDNQGPEDELSPPDGLSSMTPSAFTPPGAHMMVVDESGVRSYFPYPFPKSSPLPPVHRASAPSAVPPRMRTSQACQKCRYRKVKCSGDKPMCQRCALRGLDCDYRATVKGAERERAKSLASANPLVNRQGLIYFSEPDNRPPPMSHPMFLATRQGNAHSQALARPSHSSQDGSPDPYVIGGSRQAMPIAFSLPQGRIQQVFRRGSMSVPKSIEANVTEVHPQGRKPTSIPPLSQSQVQIRRPSIFTSPNSQSMPPPPGLNMVDRSEWLSRRASIVHTGAESSIRTSNIAPGSHWVEERPSSVVRLPSSSQHDPHVAAAYPSSPSLPRPPKSALHRKDSEGQKRMRVWNWMNGVANAASDHEDDGDMSGEHDRSAGSDSGRAGEGILAVSPIDPSITISNTTQIHAARNVPAMISPRSKPPPPVAISRIPSDNSDALTTHTEHTSGSSSTQNPGAPAPTPARSEDEEWMIGKPDSEAFQVALNKLASEQDSSVLLSAAGTGAPIDAPALRAKLATGSTGASIPSGSGSLEASDSIGDTRPEAHIISGTPNAPELLTEDRRPSGESNTSSGTTTTDPQPAIFSPAQSITSSVPTSPDEEIREVKPVGNNGNMLGKRKEREEEEAERVKVKKAPMMTAALEMNMEVDV